MIVEIHIISVSLPHAASIAKKWCLVLSSCLTNHNLYELTKCQTVRLSLNHFCLHITVSNCNAGFFKIFAYLYAESESMDIYVLLSQNECIHEFTEYTPDQPLKKFSSGHQFFVFFQPKHG